MKSVVSFQLDEDRTEVFWSMVTKGTDDGCWLWNGARFSNGYGAFRYNSKPFGVHRISYCLEHGAFQRGLFVCHKCDVRHCVNPKHLFLGTVTDNARDMISKGRDLSSERRSAIMLKSAARGETHYRCKLTDKDVFNIFLSVNNGATRKQMAEKYHVCRQHIDDIINQKKRKFLTYEP